MKQGIQEIVYNINKISFLSYKLLNFHFTRLLEENKKLPELTQNLFYNACCYVSVMKNRKSAIDKEDEMYKSFSHFLYLEHDILLSKKNIIYWNVSRKILKSFNLIPGFIRIEKNKNNSRLMVITLSDLSHTPQMKKGLFIFNLL